MPDAPDLHATIDGLIRTHDVVVFAKTYCPHCQQTKELFRAMGMKHAKIVDLDVLPNGHAYQSALAQKTRQRTVPNVFVRGTHIGGNDDTQAAYRAGTLTAMLAK